MRRVSVVFVLAALSLGGFHAAEAQTPPSPQKVQKPKTRVSAVLGKAAFQKIDAAQKLMEDEKFAAALAALQAVLDGAGFKPYDKAVALQTMGFVHAAQNDYPKAIAVFQKAIAAGDLPLRVVSDLNYNLAQLYLAEGKAAKSLRLLEGWFARLDKQPGAPAYALKAQAHVTLEQWAAGEQAILTAFEKTKTKSDAPQNWTRILLAILLNQERYEEARPVLEAAVVRWPDERTLWQQLTAVAYQTDDEELAFVAQQAMHVQGMLTSSKDLAAMAQLYLYHNVPIKAAALLQTGMADGTVDKTAANYQTLAQAYMYAREWGKAIAPLTIAAEKSEKGQLYAQLADAYVQDEKWAKAEAALVKALEKGGLDNAANSWLLLGIARTRLEKYQAAISAFRKAGDDDAIAKDAFGWIRSIERRLAADVSSRSPSPNP